MRMLRKRGPSPPRFEPAPFFFLLCTNRSLDGEIVNVVDNMDIVIRRRRRRNGRGWHGTLV